MTIDERELGRALQAYAAQPVTDADTARARADLSARLERRRRDRRRATVAAVLVVVLTAGIGSYWWLLRSDTRALSPATGRSASITDSATTTRRAPDGLVVPTVGFIGLPPPGAVPSTPEVGTLIDQYPLFDGRRPWRGGVRLYADGRLIWDYDYPVGPRTRSTGYLEQRLTAEGVELVRSHPAGVEKDPWNLDAWLPQSAWADRTIRPYVPSRFGACVAVIRPDAPIEEREWGTPGVPQPIEDLLRLLPQRAAELLRGRTPVPPLDDSEQCLGMTTAEARQLDQALLAGGLTKDEDSSDQVLAYTSIPLGQGRQLALRLEPVYPDGFIGCSPCG